MENCLMSCGLSSKYLLWIFCVFHLDGSQGVFRGPPRIEPNEQKGLQVARLGQEFRLSCPVESDPSPIVDWFKDGEGITSAWSRFGFRRISQTLRIRPVYIEDSGVYECKGVNGFGSAMARIRVLVVEDTGIQELKKDQVGVSSNNGNRKPRIETLRPRTPSAPELSRETLEQAIHPINLSTGNAIQLRCEAKGVPAPKITWLKDGNPIAEKFWKLSTWKLVLTKLELEDSGIYECLASNTMGKRSAQIRLNVADLTAKRRPELASDFPSNQTVESGSEAVLKCVVRSGFSSIPPHIKWLKRVDPGQVSQEGFHGYNNHRLLPADNTHVLVIQETQERRVQFNESEENGVFISKLIISSTESGDEGNYICLATNSQGYTFKEAKLTILPDHHTLRNSTVSLPLPLIVIGISILAGLLFVGCIHFLRKFQETKNQLKKGTCPKKAPSSSLANSTFHPQQSEQRQPLVSTSLPSSSPSSDQSSGHSGGDESHYHTHHHHAHNQSIPVELALSHCSCPRVIPPQTCQISVHRNGLDKHSNPHLLEKSSRSMHSGPWR